LKFPLFFVFEDMPEGMDATAMSAPRGRMYGLPEEQKPFSSREADNFTKCETLELVRAYYRLTDPEVRKRMLGLMKSLADVDSPLET
jgi:hypothetical protein